MASLTTMYNTIRFGHLLRAEILAEGVMIANFQFFVGSEPPLPLWELAMGQNPELLDVRESSGHFFTPTPTDSGVLKGGEIVPIG